MLVAIVSAAQRVESVEVDLETRLVVVHGESFDGRALRASIDEAGYQAE